MSSGNSAGIDDYNKSNELYKLHVILTNIGQYITYQEPAGIAEISFPSSISM
jgi:hypothetical protein